MRALGIDFGASTTAVATWERGEARLLVDPTGAKITPSVVAFLPGGRELVGTDASLRLRIDPKNAIQSAKRVVGLPWFDRSTVDYRDYFAANEFKKDDDGMLRYVTRAGEFTAADIARHQFKWIRYYDEFAPNVHISCTLTVPPSFLDVQKEALRSAAVESGFQQVTLIHEPYAAALPYVGEEESRRLVAVYDLGGGTFDIAVLEVGAGAHRVLAAGGDAYLGGDDIDRVLAELLVKRVLAEFQWDLSSSPESFQSLRLAARNAKVRLSFEDSATISLQQVDPALAGKHIKVHSEELERAAYELVQGTFIACDDVLGEAGIVARQIDQVILAGGSTYLPMVRRAVEQYFGTTPLTRIAADEVVARGAAMAAAIGLE